MFERQQRTWNGLSNKFHLLHETFLSRLEEVTVLFNVQKPTRESRKIKKQRDMIPIKEQDKTPKIDFNEMEISDLPNKVFKIMVTRMLTEVRKTMHEQSENFD